MMRSNAVQKTLAGAIEFEGLGIHTGLPCRAVVRPAGEGVGLRFVRVDLNGTPELTVADVAERGLRGRTTLERGDASVQTVEHMLAALWAMGVDNATVEVTGPEIPAADGSALIFANAVAEVGLEDLPAPRICATVKSSIEQRDGPASLLAEPNEGGFRVTYTLYFEESTLAQGSGSFEITPEVFLAEIAPARTFCMASQVNEFRQAGLGKGATGRNTLVICGTEVIGNEFCLPEEPLRHKILDVVGDLALVGARLNAHVTGDKSGHELNRQMAARIRSARAGEVDISAERAGALEQ